MCCFCGKWLVDDNAAQLVVWPMRGSDESQAFYCHRRCLDAKLSPTIPRHPMIVEMPPNDDADQDECARARGSNTQPNSFTTDLDVSICNPTPSAPPPNLNE